MLLLAFLGAAAQAQSSTPGASNRTQGSALHSIKGWFDASTQPTLLEPDEASRPGIEQGQHQVVDLAVACWPTAVQFGQGVLLRDDRLRDDSPVQHESFAFHALLRMNGQGADRRQPPRRRRS